MMIYTSFSHKFEILATCTLLEAGKYNQAVWMPLVVKDFFDIGMQATLQTDPMGIIKGTEVIISFISGNTNWNCL